MDRNLSTFGGSVAGNWVALRKESVDRNNIRHTTPPRPSVALRKESVDRNGKTAEIAKTSNGRSPQGERG